MSLVFFLFVGVEFVICCCFGWVFCSGLWGLVFGVVGFMLACFAFWFSVHRSGVSLVV